MMEIKNIFLEKSDQGIFSSISTSEESEDEEYAFYLYKGNKRVSTRWYKNEKSVDFFIDQVGVYRVVGFIKKNDEVVLKSSSKFFYSGDVFFVNEELGLKDFFKKDKFPSAWYTLKLSEGANFSIILNGFEDKPVSNNFLAVFNGAVQRKDGVTPPFFSGVNLANKTKLPVVLFSDPALELDSSLTLGWYAGDYRFNAFQAAIKIVISFLYRKTRALPLFIGGSGGGFASLVSLSLFGMGSAVVWNPQTDIDKYYRKSVDKYYEIAFPPRTGTENTLIKNVCYNDCVAKSSQVIYLQNSQDFFHIERHALPFFKGSGIDVEKRGVQVSDGFTYVLGNWKSGGHVSPPFEALIAIINYLVSNEVNDTMSSVFDDYLWSG